MPYSDYDKSARCLDKRRCLKQIIEAKQIINILNGESSGWKNHPAVRMWEGYKLSLIDYYNACWKAGKEKWKFNYVKLQPIFRKLILVEPPRWLEYPRFHSEMRANLLRKNTEYYSQYDWMEQPKEGYFWPCDIKGVLKEEIVLWKQTQIGQEA